MAGQVMNEEFITQISNANNTLNEVFGNLQAKAAGLSELDSLQINKITKAEIALREAIADICKVQAQFSESCEECVSVYKKTIAQAE